MLDRAAIEDEKLGGLLGVNRGSIEEPRFVKLTWDPPGKVRGTVALVGKGITFDSGGLSLKPTDSMIGMKGDMAGAAAVLATFTALDAVQPPVRVRGYLPLTDNMPGGDATRVGDVLRIRNGTTVEVLNTDAEGRLVLADALALATEDEPDAIVDLATLTGACMVALGTKIAGLMGNHEGFLDQVQAAADAEGEPVWPLPLPADMRAELDSEVADIKNISGKRWGGASIAGVFLQEFVGDGIPWAHLDIAGPADSAEDDGLTRKGGTGFGVRTLLHLLSSFRKPAKASALGATGRISSRRRGGGSPAKPTASRAAATATSASVDPSEKPSTGIWGTCWNGDTSMSQSGSSNSWPNNPITTNSPSAPTRRRRPAAPGRTPRTSARPRPTAAGRRRAPPRSAARPARRRRRSPRT